MIVQTTWKNMIILPTSLTKLSQSCKTIIFLRYHHVIHLVEVHRAHFPEIAWAVTGIISLYHYRPTLWACRRLESNEFLWLHNPVVDFTCTASLDVLVPQQEVTERAALPVQGRGLEGPESVGGPRVGTVTLKRYLQWDYDKNFSVTNDFFA